jgi:hypothetical protein
MTLLTKAGAQEREEQAEKQRLQRLRSHEKR